MEYAFSLLLSLHAWFWHALLLVLASFSSYPIIKFATKLGIEKHAGAKLPPGPKSWPIVGNLPEMLANKPAFRWIHKLMDDMDTTEALAVKLPISPRVIPPASGNEHENPVGS